MGIKHITCRYTHLILGSVLLSLGAMVVSFKLAMAADMAATSKNVITTVEKSAKVKQGGKRLAKPKTGGAVITEPKGEPIFAIVNGKSITVRDYNAMLAGIMRQRFYHGSIPEDQAEAVYKEVADKLIERELLVGEAEKRGIRPDMAQFEKTVSDTDAGYSNDPAWPAQREKMLPELKTQMVRQGIVERLNKSIRDMPQPTLTEARAYYEQKPELFTEPVKPRLRVILLKVDPASPQEDWNKARKGAEEIYKRVKDGADFAEEARLHSAHESAANGGDMGYLHGGMLPEALEAYINKFQVGTILEPVKMLEGYGIYKMEDIIPAKLQMFSDVQERAQELLKREWADQAWQATISRLRTEAKIKIITPPNGGAKGIPVR